MLQDVLLRVYSDEQDRLRTMAHSMLISTDNAHGATQIIPPHDAQHGPILNDGPGSKLMLTNAMRPAATHAWFAHLCQTHDIPYQKFVTRADMGCGSTIGPTRRQTWDSDHRRWRAYFCDAFYSGNSGYKDAVHLFSALTHFLSLKQAPVSHAMMP